MTNKCKKCGGTMQAGKATGQTIVGGMPDFAGDTHPVTFSAGGPGKLIDCMKCVDCGWSVTEIVSCSSYSRSELKSQASTERGTI